MLFSVNNEDVLKRYLEKKNNLLEPKEGLILGNMFFDMYEPYKNYKPRELVATTEKEKLMLKIRELSHAVGDLNLYLDLCPDDRDVYELFKKYVELVLMPQQTHRYILFQIEDSLKYNIHQGQYPRNETKKYHYYFLLSSLKIFALQYYGIRLDR